MGWTGGKESVAMRADAKRKTTLGPLKDPLEVPPALEPC